MNQLLLPHGYKRIGWFLLIPALVLFILLVTSSESVSFSMPVFAIFSSEFMGKTQWFGMVETEIANTVTGVLFIVGALFVGFSKEKTEDEFIEKLRLSSLLWAVWVNYILLLLAFLFIYDFGFLNVMIYNMFTVLIIFIVRFNYILFKTKRTASHEE